MSSYLQTVADVYAQAARIPDPGLCCGAAPPWRLPGLVIPPAMLQMNYGCGSTVDPRDLHASDTVLYVGVGGGLEALQFAYLTRKPGGVVAIEPVADMRDQARRNFDQAAMLNPWFRPEFVTLLDGNALSLPVANNSATVAAQNCLFNVFKECDLDRALAELVRVLKPGGFFATSDPITPVDLPEAFRNDEIARARCLSGCLTLDSYVTALVRAGFGRVDIRARYPYRYLTPGEFPTLAKPILLESIEAVAFKVPNGPDGPMIFSGRQAIYVGPDDRYDDGEGNVLPRGLPVPVSDAAATRLTGREDVVVTAATYHHRGGGCC